MRHLRHILWCVGALCLWATAALAQEDDKGWLTRQIQDALSGAGRDVLIDGFEGALSSTAKFDRMTIADDQGIWLTLEGAELVWNRSALLRGRLEVEKLTAARLDLPRLPVSKEEPVQAEAEPFSFSLPDLPVSIEIGELGIDEISLGEPIMGEAAKLRVTANARYTDTEAFADFEATRVDGQRGDFDIEADLQRKSNVLTLRVNLSEAEGGIAARLLNLPGMPSVDLRADGSGPLDDFKTDLRLSTDGQERLAGEVILAAQAPRGASATPDRRLQADIGGDITALLAPTYREFFGTDVRLRLDALREATGAIEVSDFALQSQAANLQGQVTLNAENWPTFVAITGTIAQADGTAVLLPGGGGNTTVETVRLSVDYDASDDDAFRASFDVAGFAMPDLQIADSRLVLDGTMQGNLGSVGQFLADTTLDATGIAFSDPALGEAVGDRLRGALQINYIEGQPLRLEALDIEGTDYGLTGKLAVNGPTEGLLTRVNVQLAATDLSRFSALAGQEMDGEADLALKGSVTPLGGLFDITATGSTQDLAVGIAQADAVMAGRTLLSLEATRNAAGLRVSDLLLINDALNLTGAARIATDDSTVEALFQLSDVGLVVPQYEGPITVAANATQDARGWTVDVQTEGPYAAELTAKGLATGPDAALDFTANVPDVAPFAAGAGQDISGPVQAKGRLSKTPKGWDLTTEASGPYALTARVEGQVVPSIDVGFDVAMPEISALVPQARGPLIAEGRLRQQGEDFFIDTTARGPFGARASVAGLATGKDMSLTFDMEVPNVSVVAPGIRGRLKATGVVEQREAGIYLDANATGPYASRGRVRGIVTGPQAAVDFSVAMADIGAIVDRVNGPLELAGSARKAGTAWQVDTNAVGPAGTQARIAGQIAQSGALNLDINGTAPLGLTRPFIAPRNLQGTARFDLAVNGPAALSSLSGTIQTTGASLAAANLRVALEGIAARIELGGNRATLDVTARASNGGDVRLGGAVTLTGSLPADLSIALRDVVLTDPQLYRTSVSGEARIAGPLTGGANISGQINVGETNINVPATGLTTIGDIPPITHVGAGGDVRATRNRAGLTGANAGDDPTTGAGGPGFGLNLRVNAPNRIFVRGRGLDAELGGGLTLTGSTARVISAGRFDLIRGRLDILGKRFDLREGAIVFQGELVPFLRFVSATSTATGEVRVVIDGPANNPEVTFESTPEAPQDEVLAQLLFGRNLSQISAFQALQLASAVATLAGRGGGGIIGNLRDGFELDDLDVTTTDSGATALRLGKYISDNVYTDVTATSEGDAELSLNVDLNENLTARGGVSNDGNTSIGIFFEKDY